jgi:hypothetical protein
MRNKSLSGSHARCVIAACVFSFAAFLIFSQTALAASWNGIEPLKSRRADVEKVLGQPMASQSGDNGALHFKVAGGIATVVFVDAKFVVAKRLSSKLEGTVRQIVLQHENSSDTPESMGLVEKSAFKREDGQGGVIKFSNLKEGVVYTFIGGRLKTTYFTPSTDQWSQAQK